MSRNDSGFRWAFVGDRARGRSSLLAARGQLGVAARTLTAGTGGGRGVDRRRRRRGAIPISRASTTTGRARRCNDPSQVADKQVLSDEEAEDLQADIASRLDRDRRDGGAQADVSRSYNEAWMDPNRMRLTADKRTSLIIDPPDGRIPPRVERRSPPRNDRRRRQRTCRRAASMPGSRRATATWTSATAASSGAGTRAAGTRTCRPSTTTWRRSSRRPATSSSIPR